MRKFSILIIILILGIVHSSAQLTINGNFIYDGINRSYRLYIPPSYNNSIPAPLILNLHGYGSTALEHELYTNFKPISDTAGFIIVHPNGSVDGFGNQQWNAFNFTNVNDVGYLSALVDTIAQAYNIDSNSIYSTGMSNGGFMSYKLACELGDKIAAIASVTGTMTWTEFNNCNPAHATPVMQIHGTADVTVPYNGSLFFVPVDSLVKFWVDNNACNPNFIFTAVPDINTNDNSTAEHYHYENGTNGSSVELYKIINGGHSWPGAPITINVTNNDISASVEIWRFFRKYKLNILTSTPAIDFANNEFFIFIPIHPVRR